MTAQEALKLDIGLSREGLQRQNLQQSLRFLKQSQSSFQVIGLMSHFANTEDVTEQSYAKFQLDDEFRQMAQELKNTFNLPSSIENHIGASATALVLPEAR
jgi:alanine racemase